jgi:pimeloyl-ACP methyl ester carboxylesterase
MRSSLASETERSGVDRVIVVGYSMGGLVARAALKPHEDSLDIVDVPLLITIATPFGGVARAAKWASSPAAPDSWADLDPDGPFLEHLFDEPLPGGTQLHVLYGTAGDSSAIPGPDDGSISLESASRPEALQEATSVTVFEKSGHMTILTDPGPQVACSALIHAVD